LVVPYYKLLVFFLLAFGLVLNYIINCYQMHVENSNYHGVGFYF
jgi:hypothetical protein